ncbi:MAG TPA: hypothetical protein DHV31_00775 [Clostridiales bacterium]|nr:hypothetical protein [Clostridiales bacterium]
MTDTINRKKMDLFTASVTLIAAFAAQYVVQFFLALMPMSDAAFTWSAVIANQVILFVACFLFCRQSKVSLVEITGVKRPPKWYCFVAVIFIALACLLCFAPLAGLMKRMLEKIGYEVTPNYFIPMQNRGLFALSFLALTILPAICEETAVRGVFLSGAKQKSAVFAIFLSAAVFALMHGNFNQLVNQFLIGVVAAYLVCITGSIYAGALLHFMNNGLAMICEYGFANGWIDPRFYWYLCGELSAKTIIVGMCVSLSALVVLLSSVTLLLHRDRTEKELFYPPKEGFWRNVSPYLDYLSGSSEATEQGEKPQGTSLRKPDKNGWIAMAILLGMLILVLCLTLIPGANG